MLLQIERTDSPRGFRLVGELDASNVRELSDALAPELEAGGDLTLDLRELSFMDSSGIQVFVRSAQALDSRGSLVLQSPSSLVRRILELIPVARLENVRVEDGAPQG
jgi:anti-sigma B factor antagonist